MNEDRVRRIAAEFDERIANEPKVSDRGGRYYVFDGQHTIAARKFLNGGKDLPIRRKVFYGLTESDEGAVRPADGSLRQPDRRGEVPGAHFRRG